MTPCFAMPPCESWQVPGGTLLYSRHNGARIVVTNDVAAVVRTCDSFLPLEEHVGRLMERFPGLSGQPEDVRKVLESLRDAGVLVPLEALCEGGGALSGEASPPGRPSICIVTCDRPDQVGRLLDSMLRNVRLSRFERVYLIDDSRDAQALQRNAELMAEFGLVSPAQAVYVGPEVQASLMASLVEAFPRESAALECLLGRSYWGALPTYGRARNLALLLTVGERCVVVDDDVVCEAWKAPEAASRLAFGGEREAHFSLGGPGSSGLSPLGEDPLQAITRGLGSSLERSLDQLGLGPLSAENLAGIPALYLERVGPDSPVLVTQCGTLGDPGTPDNSWLANLDRASVQRLLALPGGLAEGFASRQVWLGYSKPTLSEMANMSQLTGLDNRALLPPYLSALRGEDRLFGTLTGCLHPRSLVLDHNWAITHRPLPQRSGNPEGDPGVPLGGAGLLDSWVEALLPALETRSPEARLAHVAEHIGALGELSDGEMRVQFGRLLSDAQVLRLNVLDQQLRATGGASAAWEAWLNRSRQAVMQALQTPLSLASMPMVPAGRAEADVAQAVRSTATHYASLLRQWPGIRAAAAAFSKELP